MKNIIVLFSFLFLLFSSCEECDPVLTIMPDDVLPDVCVSDGVFSTRLSLNLEGNPEWYFDKINDPFQSPLNSNQLDNLTGSLLGFPFLSNSSAYDQQNDRYAYAHYYDFLDGTFGTRFLYLVDTETNGFSLFSLDESYVAPVFLNGELYGIETRAVSGAPGMREYAIVRIDQATGASTELVNAIFQNRPLFNEWFSATSNEKDKIFFAAADHIITFSPTSNEVSVVVVDEDNNDNTSSNIYGLEYQQKEGRLVAINVYRDAAEVEFQIVDLEDGNPISSNYLMDLDYLGPFPGEFAFTHYSTTINPCTNQYYLSVAVPGFTYPFPVATNLSIIDLTNKNQSNFSEENFYLGLEYNLE